MFANDLFLCHHRADKDWVRNLATSIETERHKDRKLKVFFDEWDIRPGENIISKIDEGMKRSRFVGVVLSKSALSAEWPVMELSMAVCKDPSGRKGTVIPMWLGKCQVPAPLVIRNFLDFSNEREYARAYSRLIAILKDEALPRGETSERVDLNGTRIPEQPPIGGADELDEQIASNMLPLIHIPRHVWVGPCGTIKHKDVFRHLKKVKSPRTTFALRSSRLYSFWNMEDPRSPFRELLTGDNIEKIEITPLLNNLDKDNILIELLNLAFRNHCRHLNLQRHKKHDRHFFESPIDGDKTVELHTGQKRATRLVVKKYNQGGKEFWKHYSLRGRFMNLNSEIFLQLVPGYMFTEDGYAPVSKRDQGILSTKWTHNKHNSLVFYDIRFWCYILSGGQNKIQIHLGGDSSVEIDTTPSVAEISKGIYGDHFSMRKIFELGENDDGKDADLEEDSSHAQ